MGRAATGSVRKLPSGRWQARFSYPDGVSRSAGVTFDTKSAAKAWCAQQHADVSRDKWTPEASKASVLVTFASFSTEWLDKRKVKGGPLSPRTRQGYQDLLDRFILPTFGAKPVHLISRDAVEHWYDRTATDRPTYRAKAYSLLRTILGSAVEDGHLAANPARIRGAGSVDRKHEVRVLEPDELFRLVAAMPPRYRLMVELATWCALRFGELTELRRKDIDVRRAVIHVRRAVVNVNGEFVVKTPKSAAGRRDVAIPADLVPLVAAHLLEHAAAGEDGLLFPARSDETQHLRQSSLARAFYPAREAAGRPDLRFHDLRHTGAVLAAQEGATPAELMLRLGHSTVGASMRYQSVARGRDAAIADRLSERRARWRAEASSATS